MTTPVEFFNAVVFNADPDEPFVNELDGSFAYLDLTVPPEAWKNPDELAAELFLGSMDVALAASIPEPPEMPALSLAA